MPVHLATSQDAEVRGGFRGVVWRAGGADECAYAPGVAVRVTSPLVGFSRANIFK